MASNKIKKRDGRIVDLDQEKITNAIFKAVQAVGGEDREEAKRISNIVIEEINKLFPRDEIPGVEDIQDVVEKMLIESGHAKTAKAYILYRAERKDERDAKKAIIGQIDETKLSINALTVLEERYLLKNDKGELVETPTQLFRRVAKNIAEAEKKYGGDPKEMEEKFFDMMINLDFLPNTPTLMNAGADLQQLSACFVLPIEDSIEGIFETLKDTVMIHKSGGGTGFSFSRLRPKNEVVKSTHGVSSGPISFMTAYDAATEVIKQGGKRRGANMGILRVDHPDIMDFITAKEKEGILKNFNISVALTDKFMEALENNEDYELLRPKDRKPIKKFPARKVFDLIVTMAWKNGEPGIIFIDRINKDNPTPHIGEIESTNPCGEQPLLPYESCNLGSINLANFVEEGKINYDKLKEIVHTSVRFLDNVIDMNKYPLQKISDMTCANRKIGLGVMGFADLLYQLGISYDSDDGVKIAEEVMKFVDDESKNASIALAEKRGVFDNFKGSTWEQKGMKMRNATTTTIAPTGTISMISDTSSGVEPQFAISFIKRVLDGKDLLYINKYFKDTAKDRGFYSRELMQNIANKGSISAFEEIPKEVRRVFVTSHDIHPVWHIKSQAAFQRHVDNAVSKTINFSQNATIKEVEDAYLLAYKSGCKGLTIYRDKSREEQILNIEVSDEQEFIEDENKCPKCEGKMNAVEGCMTCPNCGYSKCSA